MLCVCVCVCGKKHTKNKSFALSSTKECANRSFDLVQFKLYFNKYFAFIMKKRHWLSFPENIYLVFVLINVFFFFLLRCRGVARNKYLGGPGCNRDILNIILKSIEYKIINFHISSYT